MILPDVNVLVYAFREGSQHHQQYVDWLTDLVSGADELALSDLVVSGFVRIVTKPADLPTARADHPRARLRRRPHAAHGASPG